MALIKCPKCGKEFSDRAQTCPQCGTSKEEVLRLIKEQKDREAAERERIRKEREAKEAEEARIRAEKRAEWWAANKKKVGIAFLVIIAIIGILVTIIKVSNAVAKNRDKGTVQQNEKIDYSSVGRRADASYENIQSVLISLSANGSKSGNPYRLASLFTETVNPYVKEGNSKNSQDIPEAMRQFLERYDYYEVSSPNDLNVQSRGSGYIATYNIIVEWNSERTGHKRACIQKTAYFNNECKITGFIDQELWRESVADNSYWEVLSDRKLVESDLRGKTADELSIMRNSIYARHGYRFKKQKYLEYFGQFDWYRPNTDNQQVAFNRMSSIEKYNVNFIREHE